MKCPQLSKPEATAARNQNSLCVSLRKKPWEKPDSVGGQFSSGQDIIVYLLFTYCFN